MNLHTVFDHQQGLAAYTFASPDGWQASSQVAWNYQNSSHAVTLHAITYNPQTHEAIEFLPVESFFWLEPNYMTVEGQMHLGQVCLYPRPAFQALLDWVLPKYRGNRPGLRVVQAGPMPELPQMLGMPLGGVPHEGAGLKVEYSEGRVLLDEEFYGVVTYQQNGTQTNWGFANLLSFRAAQGQLESLRSTFWDVARSRQMNPAYEQVCAQIYQQLAQGFAVHIQQGYQQIEAANQLGRTAAAYREEVRHHQQQQFDYAMRPPETSTGHSYSISEARGDELMGRQRVDDPSAPGGVSYHEGHPEVVWTDGQNNYQTSQDPNYNPNLDPKLHAGRSWTLLPQSQIRP
jgi:hypothetical protein